MAANVFLITSHYMGVLYIEELLKTEDEIVGVAAWPKEVGFYEGWYVPEEYDVRKKAFDNYIPLYEPKPKDLNSVKFLDVIRRTSPDFIVSGYYSKLFSDELLMIPPGGCINIHPTGLPRYRGLSPYFTHMLFGDDKNSITLHWLDSGVDTGDIIAQESIDIKPDETGFECGHRLTEAGAEMFSEYWPLIKAGDAPSIEQDESEASEFNFSWDMAEIDWSQSATQIWNLVRSLTKPLGGAWTMAGGYKMHIWSVQVIGKENEIKTQGKLPGQVLAMTGNGMWVQCGEGQLRILEASLDHLERKTPFELLSSVHGQVPLILGR